MPDLNSELKKIAGRIQFDDDEPSDSGLTHAEEIFNHVRDNPGRTARQVSDALPHIAPGGIHPRLFAMEKRGLVAVHRNDYPATFKALVSTYPPFDRKDNFRRMIAARDAAIAAGTFAMKKKKPKAKPKAEVAKPRPPFRPPPAVAPTVEATMTADYILNHMPVIQARALYEELHKVFGR